MNTRIQLQQMVAMAIALFLVTVIGIVLLNTGVLPTIQLPDGLWNGRSMAANVASSDYTTAADVSAYRWQAMARFYEKNGLLTRDAFNYEQAADNMAARWVAMAKFYEKNGLLTRDAFNYEQAADNMAARWVAMARFYEQHGLLNER
jgi:hypothetical protein